jgi:hypothetical protein
MRHLASSAQLSLPQIRAVVTANHARKFDVRDQAALPACLLLSTTLISTSSLANKPGEWSSALQPTQKFRHVDWDRDTEYQPCLSDIRPQARLTYE